MTDEEKRGMKAACVPAAAALVAARDSSRPGGIDLDERANLAALLYVRVVAVDWKQPLSRTALRWIGNHLG
jgi:hypothetical protein